MNVNDVQELPSLPRSLLLGKGGFGEVYRHPERSGYCVKKFRQPLVGDQMRQLTYLIECAARVRPSVQHLLASRLAWPMEAFGKSGSLLGYSMPEAPTGSYFELVVANRATRQLLQSKYLIDLAYFQSAAVSSPPPSLSLTNRIELAIDLHRVLAALHDLGVAYGDLSSNNICAHLGEVATVFLLDADSIRTISEADESPVDSPDWGVDSRLGPVQRDWAKYALYVWRVFAQSPASRPTIGSAGVIDALVGAQIGRALVDLYDTGRSDLAANVSRLLQAALGAGGLGRLVARDAAVQFARPILYWDRPALRPEDRELARQAERFLELERELEQSTGLVSRLIRRQMRESMPFRPDGEFATGRSPVPTSDEELERLVVDAQFEAIVSHLTGGRLGSLGSHRWLDQVIGHALVEEGPLGISVAVRGTRATIDWAWPDADWINAAVVEVESSGFRSRAVVTRNPNEAAAHREVPVSPGTALTVRAWPAVSMSEQHVVGGACVAEAAVSVPLPPRVDQPLPRRPVTAPKPLAIIDPVREMADLRAMRRRSLLRGVALAGAAVLVAVATVWVLRAERAIPPNPTIADTASGRVLTWDLGDEADDLESSMVVIERSNDGGTTWAAILRVPASDRAVRVLYVKGEGLVTYRVVAELGDRLQQVGNDVVARMVSAPSAVVGVSVGQLTDSIEVSWSEPLDSGGALIDRYLITMSMIDADGNWSLVSREEVTGATTRLSLPPVSGTPVIVIRAINAAGVNGEIARIEGLQPVP